MTYLKKDGDYTKRRCTEIHILNQNDSVYSLFAFNEIAKRDFKKFDLGFNKKINDLNINLANEEISKIVKSQDTLNGVMIHFGDSCVYDYFVKSYDLAFTNKSHFGFYGSDFWFFYYKRPEIIQTDIEKQVDLRVACGTQDLMYYEESLKKEAVRKAKNEEMLEEFTGKYYPIMTSFIFIFIILSYRKISRTRYKGVDTSKNSIGK